MRAAANTRTQDRCCMTDRLSSNKRTSPFSALAAFALVVLLTLGSPSSSLAAEPDDPAPPPDAGRSLLDPLLPLPICLPLPIPILGCHHHHPQPPPPPPPPTPPPPPASPKTSH